MIHTLLAVPPRDGEACAGWLRETSAQYARWHLRFIELTAR